MFGVICGVASLVTMAAFVKGKENLLRESLAQTGGMQKINLESENDLPDYQKHLEPEARGVTLKEGDKVVLWYSSGNRDEKVFEDPYRFDLARQPNEHVGFGGPGPHFCLGANLARREIRVLFERILRRLPDLEISGPPERLQSNFINGIKRMPCVFTPGKPLGA